MRGAIATGLESLAANIVRLRQRRGWTQERLAETADLTPRYIQTLESGRANPTVSVVLQLAGALQVVPGRLFRPATLPERRPGRPKRRGQARPRKKTARRP